MRTRLLLLAALLGCAAPRPQPPRGAEVFTVEGKVENAPFRYGQDDLPLLPRRHFDAVSPYGAAATTARFEGVSIAAVLSQKMEIARGADVAVFHGSDGVAVPVPLALIRQLRPVLADRVDGAPVTSGRAGASPLQLAWPNLDQPGIDTDPRMRWWWVGGVSRIVVESWTTSYGRALRVPQGASNAARLGAEVLASQCIACHRVRGLGGTRGPDLLESAAARDAQALGIRLRAHLRHASGMATAPELRPDVAQQVAAFVDAARVAGTTDEDLPIPAPPPPPESVPTTRPVGR